jgi:arginyl-tRNA synthetase
VAVAGAEHAGVDPLIRRSERADYQANVAMSLGKLVRRPPREVAQALIDHLDLRGVCDKAEMAGPGFINLSVSSAFLAESVSAMAREPRFGVAAAGALETVVIYYSSPNMAKELHVGHLRSSILGDSLSRVFDYLGHRVIRQNHLGDWGTPFGMLIEHLVDVRAVDPSRSLGDWNSFYREARAKFDQDAAFAERARKRVVLLQGGDEPTLALWRQLIEQSRTYLGSIYERLGVLLTDADVCGESFYNPMLHGIVDALREKGLLEESGGALCVFLPGYFGKTGDPLPLIVRKQDGGYGYAATDLAAIRHRTETLGGQRLLYVVGSPQQLHLEMVFQVAARAEWLVPPVRAEHVAFGAVLGEDRKMFQTRKGESVSLLYLLDEACERAGAVVEAKNPDLPEERRREVARMVGIGAVKYADLSSDRVKDYVFDWDRMLAFEGNTGPYLQYAHARIQSIFRKAHAGTSPVTTGAIRVVESAERALAFELLELGAAVNAVAETAEPHKLCTYLYKLAMAFMGFYEQCPVLRAASDAERESRLALSQLTSRVLAQGLGLLGIEAPEEM